MANQYRSVLETSGPAPTGGNALPAEVLSGKTFTNDNGAQTGTMTNNGAVSQTLSAGQSYTIPEGYHNGNGVVTADQILATQEAIDALSITCDIGDTVIVSYGKEGSGNATVTGGTVVIDSKSDYSYPSGN